MVSFDLGLLHAKNVVITAFNGSAGTVASMPDFKAAKERARQRRLDRAVMDRAKHLKVTR